MSNPFASAMRGNRAGGDPFGSMQGFMNQFRGFMQNPAQMLTSRLGIPNNLANDPNGAIQWLMNNGKLSQEQYNKARELAGQIQSNPQFNQIMGGNNAQK